MAYQQKKPRETVTARIEKIWDDPSTARGMQLEGLGRMGASYQKTLQDVTEGGSLAEGLTVTVEYTVNGQYKNAERITIDQNQAAPPNQEQPAGDPMAKGGKATRLYPHRYRHPDEANRIEALNTAVAAMTATGELGAAGDALAAAAAITDLAELFQAFVEDQVDANWIKDNVRPMGAALYSSTPTTPVDKEPEPSQAAKAAAEASTQPGPAEPGGDAMSRWMSGE